LEKLTLVKARILAKVMGDGNITRRYVRYNNTRPELLDEFECDMKAVYGKLHFIKGAVNSGTSFVQVQKKEVIQDLLMYHPNFKSGSLWMPAQVKHGDIEIKRHFIRSFYDDEGSPTLRLTRKTCEWKRSIHLDSKSLRMLRDIHKILLGDFSIQSGISKQEKQRDKKKYVWYRLEITKKENIERFYEHFHLISKSKVRRLELLLLSYHAPRGGELWRRIFNELARLKPKS
jgi:hypothetical protein